MIDVIIKHNSLHICEKCGRIFHLASDLRKHKHCTHENMNKANKISFNFAVFVKIMQYISES